MSKISFLILVVLATAVTSTPTKGVAEGGCKKGLLSRTLRRLFCHKPATEDGTTRIESNRTTTGSNRERVKEAQVALFGEASVKRENVDEATFPTTHFSTTAEASNGEHVNWEQAKGEFYDKYNAKELPKMMNAKLEDFKLGKELGRGSFGVVYKVVKEFDGKEYAMKTMKKVDVDEHEVKHEKMLMYAVNSKYLSKLRYYFEDSETIYIVIDFVDGVELFEHVYANGRLTEDEARYCAADVVRAIEHLHNVGCIHRDIKLENIMIDTQRHCTVIDLGVAELLIDRPTIHSHIEFGSLEYSAPEVLNHLPYGKRIDCWSFGVVLYEMVVGRLPFDGKGDLEVRRLINECKITYPQDVPVSNEFKHLISKLLTLNVDERYDINGIKADPWFKQCFNRNDGAAKMGNISIPAQ